MSEATYRMDSAVALDFANSEMHVSSNGLAVATNYLYRDSTAASAERPVRGRRAGRKERTPVERALARSRM